MLDGHGNYRIGDYEECFGMFERFENLAGEVLGRIKSIRPDIAHADVHRDFAQVAGQLGRDPHFEELMVMSHLGAEYCVGLFGSFGRFKQVARSQSRQSLLGIMREDYLRLKKLLGTAPNASQMESYTGMGHKLKEMYPVAPPGFGGPTDYGRFLRDLGISDMPAGDPVPDSLSGEMRERMILKFEDDESKRGRQAAMEALIRADRVPYLEWFGSKERFIDILDESGGDYHALYQKLLNARDGIAPGRSSKYQAPAGSPLNPGLGDKLHMLSMYALRSPMF